MRAQPGQEGWSISQQKVIFGYLLADVIDVRLMGWLAHDSAEVGLLGDWHGARHEARRGSLRFPLETQSLYLARAGMKRS